MPIMKIEEVLDTNPGLKDPQEYCETIFKSIASHFEDNASRYADLVVGTYSDVKIEILIPPNGLVEFKLENTELIKERK